MRSVVAWCGMVVAFLCFAANAQQSAVIAGKIEISEEQKLFLQAAQSVAARDFSQAEALYSKIIAVNSNSAEAYIQRGITRRELKDEQGQLNDARAALVVLQGDRAQNPNDARVYYQYSLAYRLLKQFPQARAALKEALIRNNKQSWRGDFQAIELEEMASKGVEQ